MIARETPRIKEATGGLKQVQDNWMPASAVRAIIHDDPCLIWLAQHGKAHGFVPDEPKYSFLNYIAGKAKEFEDHWVRNVATPNAVMVCAEPYLVRNAKYVGQTLDLMACGTPVIFQGALWWPDDEIYGTPDIICLRSWLFDTFPQLRIDDDKPDHYVILDMKYTTGLDTDPAKKKDLAVASAQTRIYTYMIGRIQQVMPSATYIVTRDRPLDPIKVDVLSRLGQPLDDDLAECRRIYQEILRNPDTTPWTDYKLRPNLGFTSDEPWHSAKKIIATERIEGGMPELLYYISRSQADRLRALGYPTLDAIRAEEPGRLPLPMCQVSLRQCAILYAQRARLAPPVPKEVLPSPKPIELFVDYEYVNNTNVRFTEEWPDLRGRDMVFMIGVGRMTKAGWSQSIFVAESETPQAEMKLFKDFVDHLDKIGVIANPADAAIYHWCPPERWQTQRFIDRVGGRLGYLLSTVMPRFIDMREIFHAGNVAIPGALDYGLKTVAKALSTYNDHYACEWPDDGVMDGAAAMACGFEMLSQPQPRETPEYKDLCAYLEIDCRALNQILRWLRDSAI